MASDTTRRERGWNFRRVTLECPHCHRTMVVALDQTDPPGTARVVASCNLCPHDAAIVDYFYRAGRQIDLDGRPMSNG